MTQVCRQCSRINPPEASYCYHDGVLLGGHSANGGPLNAGAAPFPSQFVFPNGLMCRNFDQLAMSCQEHWSAAADLLRQGFLSTFLGGMGRADLAIAANEAAQFPDRDRGLDQLLAKLPTHVLQAPKLKVEPSDINLGQLALGADLEIEFHLGNQGMRLLYGSVVSDCKWLSFGEGPGASQKLFQFGADAVLAVRVRGKHLRGGNKPMEGRLIFDSNGGSIIVAVRAYVPIAPFTEGVLAGSTTPRQIAEKAKAAPKEAAALFEKGAVANWFQRNGWSYPVQGPSVGGIGGVQQFFEALGLAKPPKLEMKTTALALKGEVGQPLQTSLEVTTRDNKVLYAHATCDQLWVDVSKVKLSGRNAVITVSVPSVPDRPGETLQARITVYGNGNQRFVAALAVEVEGNPFADFGASAPGAAPVPVAKLIEERAAAPRMVDAAQSPAAIPLLPAEPVAEPLADPANPFAVIPFSVTGSVGVSTPLSASAEHVRAPADHAVDALDPRARRPFWQHLIPLALLAAALLGVMIRDLACKPSRAVSEGEIDHTQRLVVRFDFGPKTNQSASFGLVMLDSAKDEKKLTFDPSGTSNSTVVTIDGKT
ncbi:MAG: hypothetical protein HY040_17560, partial [Planctomycetes bacterium]|nr:hypothetical protein [Planctomycetota bacterium]